jgi:hypothetical protein
MILLYLTLLSTLAACDFSTIEQSPSPSATSGPNAGTGHYSVLFDATHAETAGNADWIISTSIPDPLQENANPRSEKDWTGGISAWGVALQQSGRYTLKTNRQLFTYGNQSNILDLSKFNALVIPEPNTRFTSSEKTALLNFVRNGGGLFMIADHTRSDRNNDGYDSPKIFNELLNNNAIGLKFDETDIGNENPSNETSKSAATPLLNGPFGRVRGSIIRDGTTLTLSPAQNAHALGIIYRNKVSNSGNSGVFLALSTYGNGRLVAIGDSSPADDGTCSPGNTCYDGWNDPAGQNAALFLNATEWLASAKGLPTT